MHHRTAGRVPLWVLFLAVALFSVAGAWKAAIGSASGGTHGLRTRKNSPWGRWWRRFWAWWRLVLGFTFSLAASRFDARRMAVLEEANAIGTTYLRARLLA